MVIPHVVVVVLCTLCWTFTQSSLSTFFIILVNGDGGVTATLVLFLRVSVIVSNTSSCQCQNENCKVLMRIIHKSVAARTHVVFIRVLIWHLDPRPLLVPRWCCTHSLERMLRYWGDFSLEANDLCSTCAIPQCYFVMMYQSDWQDHPYPSLPSAIWSLVWYQLLVFQQSTIERGETC